MQGFLSEHVKFTRAITVTTGAASTTDVPGAGLDMSGFDSVACIIQHGAIVSGATNTFKWQQSDDDGDQDAYSDLEGTLVTVADTDDEKVNVMCLHKPLKRYVRIYNDRATQNATCTAIYMQYDAKTVPTSQATGITVGTKHVSPAEGTA